MRSLSRRAGRIALKGQKAVVRALRPVRRRRLRPPAPPAQIHLGWPEDPARTLTVIWFGTRRDAAALVEIRPEGADAWRRIAAESRPAPGPAGFLHFARIAALEPDTAYDYRVSGGARTDGPWSEVWRMRTAPPAGEGSLRAVVFGDTGIAGRPDGQSARVTRVVAEMARDAPQLALGTGDYAYANSDARWIDPALAIDAWFEQMQPLLANAPFMPAWGNHEVRLGERYEEWAPRFALPDGPEAGRSYSFDAGAAHFCSVFAPGEVPTQPHLAWLDADLAAARRAGAVWLIVFQHAPVFSHGSSHPAHAHARTALAPILERHGVALHLSGHDQNYERTFPLEGTAKRVAERGVVYAKISPAGKRSSRGNRYSRLPEATDSRIAARDDTCHHYGLLQVTPDRLALEIVGIPDDDAPRRCVDRLELTRP